MQESPKYLKEQLITYIGNKRALLDFIENCVKEILCKMHKSRCVCLDLFSGSGVVSRLLKKYSLTLFANDIENYAKVISDCYLTNRRDFPEKDYNFLLEKIQDAVQNEGLKQGIITQNYSPEDDNNIKIGERVFYTRRNAMLIDTYRQKIAQIVPKALQKFFLAPLITEASIHVNTSGVFKGFYKDKTTHIGCFGASGKNALSRIKGDIKLKKPLFSNFDSDIQVFNMDALALTYKLCDIDIAYLDPPYNQHPYGSNYFMLNMILKNKIEHNLSLVSGIEQGWNRSDFNKKAKAVTALEKIVSSLKAKVILLSYNGDGLISFNEMQSMLCHYGKLDIREKQYNVFRACRNLRGRSLHTIERLFILEKS